MGNIWPHGGSVPVKVLKGVDVGASVGSGVEVGVGKPAESVAVGSRVGAAADGAIAGIAAVAGESVAAWFADGSA
jgi:hypothetical protein